MPVVLKKNVGGQVVLVNLAAPPVVVVDVETTDEYLSGTQKKVSNILAQAGYVVDAEKSVTPKFMQPEKPWGHTPLQPKGGKANLSNAVKAIADAVEISGKPKPGSMLGAAMKSAEVLKDQSLYDVEAYQTDLEQLVAIDAKVVAANEKAAPLLKQAGAIMATVSADQVARTLIQKRVADYVSTVHKLEPKDKLKVASVVGTVEIGSLSMKRSVQDIQLAYKHMGPEVFWKVATVTIKACDDYLTLPQREEVLKTEYVGARSVTVTPSKQGEELC